MRCFKVVFAGGHPLYWPAWAKEGTLLIEGRDIILDGNYFGFIEMVEKVGKYAACCWAPWMRLKEWAPAGKGREVEDG